MTMINKCLTRKASGFDRPRLALLQVLWGMVTGTQPIKVKGKGKGLLTKKGVEDVVETTKDDEEEPRLTRRRKTGVVIGRAVHTESDEGTLDHSKKLTGVETMSETAKFLMEMKQEREASKDDFILQKHPKGLGE
ncbi:hypothetical protein Tco_1483407 [Tanacetum coccineum]